MGTTPEGESSSVSSATGSFAFGDDLPAVLGPETVINPEGRRGATAAPDGNLPAPELWKRLFPPEGGHGAAGPDAGPAGCQLDHFVIEGLIGAGGMGAVFRATDQRLQRVVALKVLSPSLSRDSASVQRFLNEARAAARLDHENIARVYYVGDESGLYFIAHEFVTGTTIRDMIRSRGALEPGEAVNYTLQIANALNHIAAADVVHRDIKPSNIIVTPAGRAKLVDLGLAKRREQGSVDELTLAGTTLGTFDYISPEQAKDPRNVDIRSDIYSLGCTLFHMLTGAPPYPEGTVLQKLLDHQGKEPPDPRDANPKVTPQLSATVKKMMASDPKRRYATPDDLIRDLMPLAASFGLRGVNPDSLIWTRPEWKRDPFWIRHSGWMATASVLLIIVLVLHEYPQIRQKGTRPPASSERLAQRGLFDDANQEKTGAIRPIDGATSGGSDRASVEAPGSLAADTLGGTANADSSAESVGSPTERMVQEDTQPPDTPPGFPDLLTPVLAPPIARTKPPLTVFDDPDRKIQPFVAPPEPVENVSVRDTGESQRSGSGLPQSAASDRTPTRAPKGESILPAPQIVIVGSSIEDSRPFRTLEAACAEAKDDDVIELRYNGARNETERPLRVANKRIVIRAARGYRPLVRFASPADYATDSDTRMIVAANARIELVNLDIELSVRDDVSTDQWSLFLVEGPNSIRLEGTQVHVTNPGDVSAALFELVGGPITDLSNMNLGKNGASGNQQKCEIKVVECFVMGGCELLTVKNTQPARIELEESVVALEGTLLNVIGDDDMPPDNASLELQMEHVTCLLRNGLIKMDSGGDLPRFLLGVSASARNNIFATDTAVPLITMTGNRTAGDFRDLLNWEGTNNFYDQFETLWTVIPSQHTVEKTRFNFEDWKQFVGDAESGADNRGVVWLRPWHDKPFSQLTRDDATVHPEHYANSAATDLGPVGADPAILPAASRATAEQTPE